MPMHHVAKTFLKSLLPIALAVGAWCHAYGGDTDKNNSLTVSLRGGIYLNNEQAWQLEPSVAWQFSKYVGAGLGVEMTAQYNQPGRSMTIDGHEAVLSENERNIGWIIFKPYVVLKSPVVWRTSDNFYRLWFEARPGISLGCPFRNSLTYELKAVHDGFYETYEYRRFPNKDLRWVYWNACVSVNMAIERFVVGAGYAISDLDYYSGRRNITLPGGQKFSVPAKELSQSIFLSVGYSF